MKSLLSQSVLVMGLFIATTAQATQTVNIDEYAPRMESLKQNLEKKRLIVKSLINILDLKIDKDVENTRQSMYGAGKTWMGSHRNLRLSTNYVNSLFDDEILKINLNEYKRNIMGEYPTEFRTIDYGHFYLDIVSINPKNYKRTDERTFHISFGETTTVESIVSQPNYFEAVIVRPYFVHVIPKGPEPMVITTPILKEKIVVDKRSGKTVVTVSQKKTDGLWNTDIIYRNSTITMTSSMDNQYPVLEQ